MAFIKCSGGAGKLKETILWTNLTSTSNFTAQTITYSGPDWKTFEFISIIYSRSTSITSKYGRYFFLVSDLQNNTIDVDGTNRDIADSFVCGLPTSGTSNNLLRAIIRNQSSNSFQFGAGWAYSSNSNGNCIPRIISGWK